MSSSDESAGTTPAKVGSKAVAAVVGASAGGPLGALLGVALEPLLYELVRGSWQEIGDLRQRSVGRMVQDVARRLDSTPDDVVERARSTPERTQLFADAMSQAAQTFNVQKIQALARALANGLAGDDARIDEERLVVAALSNVEEPHVKVLLQLPGRRSAPSVSATGLGGRFTSPRGAGLAAVMDGANISQNAAEHVLAELVRTGMAAVDTYAGVTRADKLIMELQVEVGKLQWILQNLTKKPTGSRKPSTLKKPGRHPRAGYAITPFGA